MAKSKKKQSRNHIKKTPPLSKRDKFIYHVTAWGSAIVYILIPYFLIRFPSILIHNENIYAIEFNNTLWFVLPIILYGLFLTLFSAMNTKPIFGNPKINYFDTSRYIHVYPVFDKRYIDKIKIRKFCLKTAVIYVFIPILLYLSLFFILQGRTELDQNGITKYNIKNEIVEKYIPEKIKKYRVSTSDHYSKRSSYYTVDFTITTNDGKEFLFDSDGFRSISDMKKATELLSDKPKTIEDDYWLDRFSRNLNKEDAQIVLEIFNKN